MLTIKIYIFNNDTRRFEVYRRELYQAMPYVTGNTLSVEEFRGASNSSVLWTEKRFMQCWNRFRSLWGAPIFVPFGFKRIWEGGHGYQSQHYVGLALDMAQNLSSSIRERLRQLARDIRCFSYVEPGSLTPRWIHIDDRWSPPACATGGYILLRYGSKNPYVFTAQDALNALGFTGGGLDGIYGWGTYKAVRNFQASQGLIVDGIVGCNTWDLLTRMTRGIGKTSTVVSP